MTEAPEWARGYDVAFLKEVAALFRAEFKPYTFGAFGIPKERDIADAHAEDSLIWTRIAGHGAIGAAAIFRVLKSASTHQDFSGREAHLHKGDMLVRYIAGAPDRAAFILEALAKAPPRGAFWVEAHVEHQPITEVLRRLGFVRVMTKISASSDMRGLYVSGGTPDRLPGFLAPYDVPGATTVEPAFISPEDRAAILAEAEASAEWANHYSSYNKRHSWSAYALCGYDQGDPGFIIKPSEMSKDWKAKNPARLTAICGPTVAAARFPAAMAAADRIPGLKQRVRLMRLSAGGGELTRHSDITDPEAGTKDGQIMRFHIPVATAPGCLFRTWTLDGREEQVHFRERALCYLDTRKPHAVINPSDVERIHIVVDAFANDELRALVS